MTQGPPEEDEAKRGESSEGKTSADFAKRLRQARTQAGLEPAKTEGAPPLSLAGYGLRLASELLAGVIVGGFIGWWVDKGLGTRPWGLIILLMVGTVAGVVNVVRAVTKLNKELGAATPVTPTPGADDEDDK